MRPLHLGLVALALLAGSGGYVTQQWLARQERPAAEDRARAPGAVATDAAARAAPEAPASPFEWRFEAPDGTVHALAEWAGGLLVVNFWATWCPPCLREIPAFVALQARHADAGLQFVGIALDQREPVAAFAAEHDINYPVLVGDEAVARFMHSLGNSIGGLPYTVVLDADGKVLYTHQGEWAPAAAAATLEDLLKAH